jgi:hypothetical protein
MTPAGPSLHARPRRRTDVTEVVQDGEAVIYEPDGKVHGLNRTATILWHCLDGSVTLEELAVDLAEVYDGDLVTSRAQVLDYARDVARRGLLQGLSGASSERQG